MSKEQINNLISKSKDKTNYKILFNNLLNNTINKLKLYKLTYKNRCFNYKFIVYDKNFLERYKYYIVSYDNCLNKYHIGDKKV